MGRDEVFGRTGGVFVRTCGVFGWTGGVFVRTGGVFGWTGGVFVRGGGVFVRGGGVFVRGVCGCGFATGLGAWAGFGTGAPLPCRMGLAGGGVLGFSFS